MNESAINDFGRKISEKLQADLEREVAIARHVLDPHDIIVLLMRIAAGVGGAAILAAMQIRKDGSDPSEMWDVFSASLHGLTDANKDLYLKTLAAIEADRVREAAE